MPGSNVNAEEDRDEGWRETETLSPSNIIEPISPAGLKAVATLGFSSVSILCFLWKPDEPELTLLPGCKRQQTLEPPEE